MSFASPTGSPEARRWLTLIVVCLAQLMIVLDTTIVNVALSSIQRDLHFSQGTLTWVVDAFLVTFGSLLLLAGRLGDLFGRRRVFLGGVALFTAASVVCGAAPDQALLIAARFVQGTGAALQASVILAIIVTEFPDPHERARAMSAYVFTAVAGGSLGLLAGGVLTEALSWHWIFFVNVPIGVATFLAGRILIPADSGTGAAGGIDWLGATLVTIALMSGVYAIVSATSHGWASANVLGFGAASVVLMGAFLLVEARSSHPIMPLRILRVPGLISSSIVRGFLVTGMYSTFFLGTLYLEHVLHYSALQAGAAFLPWTLSVAALSMGMTARLVERFGPMRVLLTGMAAVVLGLGMLQGTGAESHYLPLMCMSFLLIGLGIGSAFMPLLGIAMADVPPADAGLGSGIVNVSQQVAGALGLAVLTTVATNRTHALAGHERAVGALLGGYHLAYAVGAVSVAVGAVVAAALLRRPTPPVEPEVETQAEVSFFDEPVYAEMEHAEYAGV